MYREQALNIVHLPKRSYVLFLNSYMAKENDGEGRTSQRWKGKRMRVEGNNGHGRSTLRKDPQINHETFQTTMTVPCLPMRLQNYSGQEIAVHLPFFSFPHVSIYCGCPSLNISLHGRQMSYPFETQVVKALRLNQRGLHITQRS